MAPMSYKYLLALLGLILIDYREHPGRARIDLFRLGGYSLIWLGVRLFQH